MGGTIAPRATLIHLADEEVGSRPYSLFAFCLHTNYLLYQLFPTLILSRAILSGPVGMAARTQSLLGLDQGLESRAKKRG